ncbi:hypothetical protein LCGC14_1565840 [marine sediment metagenome]|uniref:Uncharacterized protein n=1 Tax=marine sediment metagenome TaxID=412755 RepID=A0A0F9J7A4_9ZZZZ
MKYNLSLNCTITIANPFISSKVPVMRILNDVGHQVIQGAVSGPILSYDGDEIGKWSIEQEEE